MLKKGLLLATVTITALAMSGCKGWLFGSQPYREVKYYSLKTPQPLVYKDIDINVRILKMLGASKNKMLYRDASFQVLIDEYNKWIQPPSFMLRQYLQVAFSADGVLAHPEKRSTFELSGSMVSFDIDLTNKEVLLGLDYKLRSKNNPDIAIESSRIIRQKYPECNPDMFADAMTKAAKRLSEIIQSEALELKKKEDKLRQTNNSTANKKK